MNKKNKKSAITGNKETSKIEGAGKTPKFNLKNGIDLRGQIKRVNPMESVGVKIFLIFLCAIVIVVMALGLLSYSKAKKTIKNNVSEAYRQTIIQTSEKLDITLKQYENLALQLYFDAQMQEDLKSLVTAQSSYEKFEATSAVSKSCPVRLQRILIFLVFL